MRQNRPKHSELTAKQKQKANVRSYSNVLQKRGKLPVEVCSWCASKQAQKHHDDYSNPRVVTWFCRACHLLHHGRVDLQRWEELRNKADPTPIAPGVVERLRLLVPAG